MVEEAEVGPRERAKPGGAPLAALAAAVRDHEANVRRREFQVRPQDQALYRRLRQICGDV